MSPRTIGSQFDTIDEALEVIAELRAILRDLVAAYDFERENTHTRALWMRADEALRRSWGK